MNPEEYDVSPELLVRLAAIHNLKIQSLYGFCPVQAEGTLDGMEFYFRSRDNYWRMEVGSGRSSGQPPSWWYSQAWPGEDFSAGFMSDEDALSCIVAAAERYNVDDRSRFENDHPDYERTVYDGWSIRALTLVDVVKLLRIRPEQAAPRAMSLDIELPSTAQHELDWIIRTKTEI